MCQSNSPQPQALKTQQQRFEVVLKRTDFIQLHQKILGMLLVQQTLAGSTVGTVRLGEHDHRVVVDDLLGFLLRGRHAGGRR